MSGKRVPQICKTTGVSIDYWNEYAGIPVWSSLDFSPDANSRSLQKFPVKKYTQIFPSNVYVDVVTPQNQQRVQRLEEIADQVNTLPNAGNFFG